MTKGCWERVHTVGDYHDGPVSGVADLDGVPHLFEKKFSDEIDDYIDRYLVSAIDQELFSLIMNCWSIWLRWRAAFDQGETTLKTHPVLPEDQERYQELKQAIGDRENPHPDRSRIVDGHFRRVGPGHYAFEVEWLTD
jgi:hypothetical protein